MSDVSQPQAGWYIDPEQPALQRYWDGAQWTERTAPAPSAAPPAAPTPPISADPMHTTVSEAGSLAQESSEPHPRTPPSYAPPQSRRQASQRDASRSQPSGRRIGRATIVFIFVGAVAIAIGGSILLNGGLPS